ncbi:von Willebrand factor D and EGF domain-containing protein-like [Ruditapes philippinarum]|uniref:von Willebrand factor D and EGF domain-containing protein-like n=1 Tax=Ruditapes philippinarum TaxID=129788 RepID=UPI00295AD136|nr:von Willebrand factor D and EGF domain-containing protein-like [Ruditapes philippinarum]
MFNGLIVILTLMLHIYQTYGSCENSILLPELAKRSRTYKADAAGTQGSDPIVVDNFLSPQWYKVSFDGQQYLMPDANSMPAYEQCGTIQPIYLSGTHPDKGTLNEVPHTFIACELYPHNVCENEIEIQIRICDGSVQYYLPRTSNNAAYCFDPPDLQNVRDFSEAPTESISTLTVKSELRFKEVSGSLLPYIAFVCTESGDTDRGSQNLFYFTYWYIDGVIEFVQKGYEGIGNLTEDSLLSRGFSLGIMIQCGVKLARNATGLMTKLFKSESFFAGIRIEETLIKMSSNEIKSLNIQPTVPYGCYAPKDRPIPTASCRTKVHLFSPERDRCVLSDTNLGAQNIKSLQALCGFEILGCYPGDPECSVTKQTSAMNITTRFLSYDDPKSYVLRLVTQSAGTHEIWKGSVLDDVVVNIKDDIDFKDKVCFSHVDPHMCTGDGKIYDNNEFAGEFILYWNTEYNIVIQEKTTSCFSESEEKGPFCTCAVAIRAGGDIFLINLCNDLKFIGMTACKDNGALVIRKQDELNYQVETHIGTLVKIRIGPNPSKLDYTNLMNIDIVMAPKDFNSTKGLCGIVDSIKENDYHDRNGKALDDSEEFINSWKIGSEDTNYLSPTCNPNVSTWEEDGEQLFCTCDCFSDDLSSSCRTLNPEAVCSPTQYINCTVELQKTDDLCSNFRDKCLPENRKKRSFTVDPDLEMQRRAKLADTTNNSRRKRQTNEQENISNEQAIDFCTNAIGQSIASKKLFQIYWKDMSTLLI